MSSAAEMDEPSAPLPSKPHKLGSSHAHYRSSSIEGGGGQFGGGSGGDGGRSGGSSGGGRGLESRVLELELSARAVDDKIDNVLDRIDRLESRTKTGFNHVRIGLDKQNSADQALQEAMHESANKMVRHEENIRILIERQSKNTGSLQKITESISEIQTSVSKLPKWSHIGTVLVTTLVIVTAISTFVVYISTNSGG